MSDLAIFIAGWCSAGIFMSASIAIFPGFFLKTTIAKNRAAAWDEGASAAQENVARGMWEDGDPVTNPYASP
jgi:hypothetical protein